MENLTEILSSPVFRSVGWTLIHSIWQLLALGSLYIIGVFFIKKASYRYALGISLLFAQVIISLVTLSIFQSETTPTNLQTSVTVNVPSFLQIIKLYFENNISLIVSLWLLGSCALLVRLALAFVFVNGIKNNSQNMYNEPIHNLGESLKLKMGINQNVSFKISKIVSLPVMMGVFKPVILIPASLVTGLSQGQLELIIAHELAHIKRFDYLVNSIQSVIEVIYFFHPCVWLLSAQIRTERENCCDDLAVSACGDNSVLLAKTLVQLQESMMIPHLALAFGKKQNPFITRVQRILGISSSRLFTKESIWILAGLCVTIFTFAQQTPSEPKVKPQKSTHAQNKTESDTLIDKSQKTQVRIRSNDVDFMIENHKIFINGREVVLSPEAQKQMDERLALITQQQDLISKQSDLIGQENEKMGEYNDIMAKISEPMEMLSAEMEIVSKKMEKVSKKYSKNINKGLTLEQLDKVYSQLDLEMSEHSKEMDKLSAEMNKLSLDMNTNVEPIDEISSNIDALSEPIDAYSKKIDNTVDEIIKLLPEKDQELLKKLNNGEGFIHPPSPPRPPKRPSVRVAVPPPPPPPPPAPRVRVPAKVKE